MIDQESARNSVSKTVVGTRLIVGRGLALDLAEILNWNGKILRNKPFRNKFFTS